MMSELDQLLTTGCAMKRKLLCITLVASLLACCGCDTDWPTESSMCRVTGQITLDGEAVPGAKIVFIPQRIKEAGQNVSKIASGTSDDRGEFILKVDSREPKLIHHDRYRVIVSKVVDGLELFHESYNVESVLEVDVDSQESIQRPKLELVTSGTY